MKISTIFILGVTTLVSHAKGHNNKITDISNYQKNHTYIAEDFLIAAEPPLPPLPLLPPLPPLPLLPPLPPLLPPLPLMPSIQPNPPMLPIPPRQPVPSLPPVPPRQPVPSFLPIPSVLPIFPSPPVTPRLPRVTQISNVGFEERIDSIESVIEGALDTLANIEGHTKIIIRKIARIPNKLHRGKKKLDEKVERVFSKFDSLGVDIKGKITGKLHIEAMTMDFEQLATNYLLTFSNGSSITIVTESDSKSIGNDKVQITPIPKKKISNKNVSKDDLTVDDFDEYEYILIDDNGINYELFQFEDQINKKQVRELFKLVDGGSIASIRYDSTITLTTEFTSQVSRSVLTVSTTSTTALTLSAVQNLPSLTVPVETTYPLRSVLTDDRITTTLSSPRIFPMTSTDCHTNITTCTNCILSFKNTTVFAESTCFNRATSSSKFKNSTNIPANLFSQVPCDSINMANLDFELEEESHTTLLARDFIAEADSTRFSVDFTLFSLIGVIALFYIDS